jgi:hypothetical protein
LRETLNQILTFPSIDEFGFSLATQRKYGRLRLGQPAIQGTAAHRGGSATVAAAIQKGAGIL